MAARLVRSVKSVKKNNVIKSAVANLHDHK